MPPVNTDARFKLANGYTASRWDTVFSELWTDALKRGRQTIEDGTLSPPLTNREAVAVIRAFRAASAMTSDGFPLWAQYAAVAYDWDVKRDRFDTSVKQMGRMYPADIGVGLWGELMHIATQLAKERPDVPPSMLLDKDTFQSLVFVQSIGSDLSADGARAQADLILPVCRDKKTGKLRFPRVPCGKDGKGPIEPITGRRMPCDKKGDCEPATVPDPITAIGRGLMPLVVGGLLLWLLFTDKPRRRRRS